MSELPRQNTYQNTYGNFPIGRIRRLYSGPLAHGGYFALAKEGVSASSSTAKRAYQIREGHKLTLEKLRSGYSALERLADKIVKLLDMLIDEYLLRNHTDLRKIELVRLMRKFIKGRKPNYKDEFRFGKLSCFDTITGITIRLFPPEREGLSQPHDLVYNTVFDYKIGVDLNLDKAPLVEANWRPDLADEALDLLRKATVLDELADV